MKKLTRLPSVALIIFALLGCGGGGSSGDVTSPGETPPPPPPPTTNSSTTNLSVTNDKYTPAHDSVAVGATLTWTWNTCSSDIYGQNTCADHSVTFDDGPTSPIQSSGTFVRTFSTAGTYPYHCRVHGTAMSGTVLVH
jgi:plastocyanin